MSYTTLSLPCLDLLRHYATITVRDYKHEVMYAIMNVLSLTYEPLIQREEVFR